MYSTDDGRKDRHTGIQVTGGQERHTQSHTVIRRHTSRSNIGRLHIALRRQIRSRFYSLVFSRYILNWYHSHPYRYSRYSQRYSRSCSHSRFAFAFSFAFSFLSCSRSCLCSLFSYPHHSLMFSQRKRKHSYQRRPQRPLLHAPPTIPSPPEQPSPPAYLKQTPLVPVLPSLCPPDGYPSPTQLPPVPHPIMLSLTHRLGLPGHSLMHSPTARPPPPQIYLARTASSISNSTDRSGLPTDLDHTQLVPVLH